MKRFFFILLLALLPGLASAACVVCGPSYGEKSETLKSHRCLGFNFGALKTAPKPATVDYRGLMLGLTHTSQPAWDIFHLLAPEECIVRGASIELLTFVNGGTSQGVAITGLLSDASRVRGLQLSGFGNRSDDVSGVQIALGLNRTQGTVRGMQFGLFNAAKELKGVQIGLLNINAAGWTFPLINFSW